MSKVEQLELFELTLDVLSTLFGLHPTKPINKNKDNNFLFI